MTAGAMTCCEMKQEGPIRLIVREALDLSTRWSPRDGDEIKDVTA
jgi:hypothetical protein